MTAAANLRKGWCPGALRPMRSGDGLLVRVRPRAGAFSLAALRAIASVSERFGSGEIDLTSRGNLQLRGVSDETYEAAIAGLDAAGLIDQSPAAEAVRNVVVDPLSGIDPSRGNVRDVAVALENSLACDPQFWSLPGKFGFSFSGSAAPCVGGRTADIMIAFDRDRCAICLDGAMDVIYHLARNEIVAALEHLARAFLELRENEASFGRMRDAVARFGAVTLFAMAGFRANSEPASMTDAASAQVGLLEHRENAFGVGIGLPFGRVAADSLTTLCQAAASANLRDVHTGPERVLVFPARCRENGVVLLEAADKLGLITRPGDVRLAMDVCPGAPACVNASTDTRRDAQRLVEEIHRSLGGYSLHVSGCEKGCARRGKADFTLVARQGYYDLIPGGAADDPVAITGVSPNDISGAISRYIMETA